MSSTDTYSPSRWDRFTDKASQLNTHLANKGVQYGVSVENSRQNVITNVADWKNRSLFENCLLNCIATKNSSDQMKNFALRRTGPEYISSRETEIKNSLNKIISMDNLAKYGVASAATSNAGYLGSSALSGYNSAKDAATSAYGYARPGSASSPVTPEPNIQQSSMPSMPSSMPSTPSSMPSMPSSATYAASAKDKFNKFGSWMNTSSAPPPPPPSTSTRMYNYMTGKKPPPPPPPSRAASFFNSVTGYKPPPPPPPPAKKSWFGGIKSGTYRRKKYKKNNTRKSNTKKNITKKKYKKRI